MSATASWLRNHRFEATWVVFSALNLIAMGLLAGKDGGTVPFHFIWVSLTLLYGFTVWNVKPTLAVLAAVMAGTSAMILLEIAQGPTRPDELTEVPLMAAMFVAMMWHARRRLAAETAALRISERERAFIRDSSHHLKTPLQVARSYAELLRAASSREASSDADRLIGELDRLTRIVNGLLLFMTSAEPEALQRRRVDLDEFLVSAASRWADAANRRWSVEVVTHGTLFVDRERLELALDALIENAVTATAEGGSIVLRAYEELGVATIEVADDGRGLDTDEASRALERFWSGWGSSGGKGTGLGLAIVKAIVEAHGGTVVISGETGVGTVVAISVGPFVAAGPVDDLRVTGAAELVPASDLVR